MLFPVPLVMGGPPSEIQLAMRPWLGLLIGLQSTLVLGRIFIVDIWGSFILLMVIIVGVVTLRRKLDVLSCVSYGFMVVFTGLFDFILLFERYARVPGPFFAAERSLQYNVASAVFLISPLLDFMGAVICWKVYSDYDNQMMPDLSMPYSGHLEGAYGTMGDPDGPQSPPPQPLGLALAVPQVRGFQPFSGRSFKVAHR